MRGYCGITELLFFYTKADWREVQNYSDFLFQAERIQTCVCQS